MASTDDFQPGGVPTGPVPTGAASLTARDRELLQACAVLLQTAGKVHDWTEIHADERGYHFDLRLLDQPGDKPTGRVARISVDLLRLEPYIEQQP